MLRDTDAGAPAWTIPEGMSAIFNLIRKKQLNSNPVTVGYCQHQGSPSFWFVKFTYNELAIELQEVILEDLVHATNRFLKNPKDAPHLLISEKVQH